MGSLRFLFAITVLFAHSIGNVFIGGPHSVQLFYMISGFLISYVLVEKSTYTNLRSFYTNRFLRLYPIYIFIAAITLIVFLATQNMSFLNIYASSPLTAKFLLVFSNIFLITQDWVMFAGVKTNQLVFTPDFLNSDLVLYKGLLVPPAWTLGLEISFYLIAPFILHRRRVMVFMLAISIIIRIILFHIGLGKQDPWTYRFFPTELAFFLLGALSNQVIWPYYKKILSNKQIQSWACLSTYLLISITLTFSLIPINETIKCLVFFSLFLIFMPFTFYFSKSNNWDKKLGDLSYPIYISHMLVLYLTTILLTRLNIGHKAPIAICTLLLSIVLAIFLNKFIGNPIESIRNRYRS